MTSFFCIELVCINIQIVKHGFENVFLIVLLGMYLIEWLNLHYILWNSQVTPYAHGTSDLLGIQIDAAINPGLSRF